MKKINVSKLVESTTIDGLSINGYNGSFVTIHEVMIDKDTYLQEGESIFTKYSKKYYETVNNKTGFYRGQIKVNEFLMKLRTSQYLKK